MRMKKFLVVSLLSLGLVSGAQARVDVRFEGMVLEVLTEDGAPVPGAPIAVAITVQTSSTSG